MQACTNGDDLIPEMLAKVPAFIFDNPHPLDTVDGMFDGYSDSGDILVKPFLHFRQLSVFRFFERLHDKNIPGLEALKATVLKKLNVIREYSLVFICRFLVVHCAFMCRAQVNHILTLGGDEVVFYSVGFFLPL